MRDQFYHSKIIHILRVEYVVILWFNYDKIS